MANFAKLDAQNSVLDVVVVSDNDAPTEAAGIAYLAAITHHHHWVGFQMGEHPKSRPGIGSTYRADIGGFVAPKPFASWSLNENTGEWEPPMPMPEDDVYYEWDEAAMAWVASEHDPA